MGLNEEKVSDPKYQETINSVKICFEKNKHLWNFRSVHSFIELKKSDNGAIINSNNNTFQEFILPAENIPHKPSLKDLITKDKSKWHQACIFVTSVGGELLTSHIQNLKDSGNFTEMHFSQSLALSLADALTEYLHRKLIHQNEELLILSQNRYSFGYPMCPGLENQKVLFELLDATKQINVSLSENFTMFPVSSVSGIILEQI